MSTPDEVAAAACRELRSLLEEFHAHKVPGVGIAQRAQISTQDLGARMNRLAALERGEVPA